MDTPRLDTLRLDGRLLFLSSDPLVMSRQLGGETLTLAQAGDLRNEISTDEITPVPRMTSYDERLGAFAYIGFKAGEQFPIQTGAVRAGGFAVTVAGERYGKGSSREHSPFAETLVGIRLVIARSFERIYRQNADNIGLFTSTDFGLIERIARGEAIPIEELLAPRDRLTATLLRAGGLLRYGKSTLLGATPAAVNTARAAEARRPAQRPLTYAEKLITRHRVVTADTAGPLAAGSSLFLRPDWRYIIEMYTGMAGHLLSQVYGETVPIRDAASILAFEDHLSYAHRSPVFLNGIMGDFQGLLRAHRRFAEQHGIRNHGFLDGEEGSEGICHPVVTERYALPGQVISATDSHTPHSGSLGALAFGVGSTEMANAMVTGLVRMTMPRSLLFRLDGRLRAGVTAKDLVLHLLARADVRAGLCVGRLVEFAGPVVDALSTDERATLTNMTAELGGFTGLVAPDAETVRFLRERRGIDFSLASWMSSDGDAAFDDVIVVDCSGLDTMVAAPGDPGNGRLLSELAERPRVDIAYGGSCTGGKRADFDQYHAVFAWAAERGLRVAEGTQLFLQFGTVGVRAYCGDQGYLGAFEAVGAEMLMPACGACANLGPGGTTRPDQVTVSAQNRNFPGRSGPGQVWVASPATVAATALAGRLISFAELREAFDAAQTPLA